MSASHRPWADLASAAPTAPAALSAAASTIPPLDDPSRYKGQAGRVAIIGGCAEYTGAPFFAAMAALRAGADLAHVFCTAGAAPIIKSYAPDLIVHPVLQEDGGCGGDAGAAAAAAVQAWLPRFDAVVVGPGLGKDPSVAAAAAGVVRAVVAAGTAGLVLDADGIALAASDPALVRGYASAVLTPNAAEFGRLAAACGVGDGSPAGPPGDGRTDAELAALAAALAGPTVLLKGAADRIVAGGDDAFSTTVAGRGSPRRAGGQGDVLAGATAAFLAWGVSSRRAWATRGGDASLPSIPPAAAAAAGGAALTRAAAARAFAAHGRAMVAADVLAQVGPAFAELFDC